MKLCELNLADKPAPPTQPGGKTDEAGGDGPANVVKPTPNPSPPAPPTPSNPTPTEPTNPTPVPEGNPDDSLK